MKDSREVSKLPPVWINQHITRDQLVYHPELKSFYPPYWECRGCNARSMGIVTSEGKRIVITHEDSCNLRGFQNYQLHFGPSEVDNAIKRLPIPTRTLDLQTLERLIPDIVEQRKKLK